MQEAEFWAKWGEEKPPRRRDGLCPRCAERPREPGKGYCGPCTRAWARKNRKKYRDLSEDQRRRARVRSYTNMLVRRGQLEREPCRVCGTTRLLEAHHPDPYDPRRVEWYCRRHNPGRRARRGDLGGGERIKQAPEKTA